MGSLLSTPAPSRAPRDQLVSPSLKFSQVENDLDTYFGLLPSDIKNYYVKRYLCEISVHGTNPHPACKFVDQNERQTLLYNSPAGQLVVWDGYQEKLINGVNIKNNSSEMVCSVVDSIPLIYLVDRADRLMRLEVDTLTLYQEAASFNCTWLRGCGGVLYTYHDDIDPGTNTRLDCLKSFNVSTREATLLYSNVVSMNEREFKFVSATLSTVIMYYNGTLRTVDVPRRRCRDIKLDSFIYDQFTGSLQHVQNWHDEFIVFAGRVGPSRGVYIVRLMDQQSCECIFIFTDPAESTQYISITDKNKVEIVTNRRIFRWERS